MPQQTLILAILPAIILLLALYLLLRGLRGKQIDTHPLCRKCRFDLFGLPPDSQKCSECGADLTKKKSIKIGHRQKYRGLILSSLILILPSLTTLSLFTYQKFSQIDFIKYKPAAWLIRDLDSLDSLVTISKHSFHPIFIRRT